MLYKAKLWKFILFQGKKVKFNDFQKFKAPVDTKKRELKEESMQNVV